MRAFNANAALDMNAPARQGAPKHYGTPNESQKRAVKPPHLVPKKETEETIKIGFLRLTPVQAARLAVLSIVFAFMLGTLTYQRAEIVEMNSTITEIETDIKERQSEKIRLENEFKSRFSIDSIEKYAEENLGMVKRQKHQVYYFVNENEDEVLIFNGKEIN